MLQGASKKRGFSLLKTAVFNETTVVPSLTNIEFISNFWGLHCTTEEHKTGKHARYLTCTRPNSSVAADDDDYDAAYTTFAVDFGRA